MVATAADTAAPTAIAAAVNLREAAGGSNKNPLSKMMERRAAEAGGEQVVVTAPVARSSMPLSQALVDALSTLSECGRENVSGKLASPFRTTQARPPFFQSVLFPSSFAVLHHSRRLMGARQIAVADGKLMVVPPPPPQPPPPPPPRSLSSRASLWPRIVCSTLAIIRTQLPFPGQNLRVCAPNSKRFRAGSFAFPAVSSLLRKATRIRLQSHRHCLCI